MELTTILERIFSTVFPMLFIVAIGYFYAKKNTINMSVSNHLNIDVFIPALIFSVLSAKSFQLAEIQSLAFAAAIVVIGSGIILYPLCKILNVQVKTFIPPMMFSNSGNLGIPLLVLAFGEQALNAAVILFVVETFLHFSLGVYMIDRQGNPWRVLRMPMIIASIAGFLFSGFSIELPDTVKTPIDMMGMVCIPLMLFSLGVRMNNIDLSSWKIGLWGAILAPLSGIIIALSIQPLLNLSPLHFSYLIVFSALPPALLNYMVAEKYQQQPEQVASIVLIGNISSLVVLPITLYFVL